MNWFVKRMTVITQAEIDQADGVCEHIKVGDRVHVAGEQDSFGPVTRFYECSACFQASQAAAGAELERCDDCGEQYPHRELEAWKPYDYYPQQGDEPTMVCPKCQLLPKHQARVERDRRDYYAEFGGSEEDDYYED